MEAARQTGTRALELSEGGTNDWNEIMQDKNFEHLPTSTPITPEEETLKEPPSSLPKDATKSNSKAKPSAKTLSKGSAWGSLLAPKKSGKKRLPRKEAPNKGIAGKTAASPKAKSMLGVLATRRDRRSTYISREVLEVDRASLGLFTCKNTLSASALRTITTALNAAPKYKEVTLDSRRRV